MSKLPVPVLQKRRLSSIQNNQAGSNFGLKIFAIRSLIESAVHKNENNFSLPWWWQIFSPPIHDRRAEILKSHQYVFNFVRILKETNKNLRVYILVFVWKPNLYPPPPPAVNSTFFPSVAEPEPQGAASFGRSRSRSRSRNAMRLRLRQWYLSWLGI
jgi:hypothetical protein